MSTRLNLEEIASLQGLNSVFPARAFGMEEQYDTRDLKSSGWVPKDDLSCSHASDT